MSVSSELYKVNVVGDGSTPTIAFNRKVFNSTDIKGFSYDTTTNVETALINGTDFTVTGAGDTSSGVTITPASSIATGTNWVLYSDAGNAQSTTLTTAGEFPAKSLEYAFDKLAIGTQEADGKADRALKLPVSDTASAELPNKTLRASKYLGFDSNGDPTALAGGTATDAGDISYLAADSGATSRTVENRLRETVSVKDYGAKGDGVTDDTLAIEAAWNYALSSTFQYSPISGELSQMQVNGPAIYFPAGDYIYNGTGLTGGTITAFSLIGESSSSVRIQIADGVYFIDLNDYQYHSRIRGIHFEGGAGTYRNIRTAVNVAGHNTVEACTFSNYTECAIGNNCDDWPYWKILNCVFSGTSSLTSIGVALSGLANQSTIQGCSFLNNKYNIKLGRGGPDVKITNCDFVHFTAGAGSPDITDIWIIPSASTSFKSAEIKNNKFGNENLSSGDNRILIADEGSGTYFTDKHHSTSPSTGSVNGLYVEGNQFAGNAGYTKSYIYSYTPNLLANTFDNFLLGTKPDAYIEFAAALTEDRNLNNLVELKAHDEGPNSLMIPTFKNGVAGQVEDPFGYASGEPYVRNFHPAGGADASFVDLLTSDDITTDGSVVNATRSGITDAMGGSNAVEVTLTADSGYYASGNGVFGSVVANKIAWIEVDLLKSSSTPLDHVFIDIYRNGVAPISFRRAVRLPEDTWRTVRFLWVPKQTFTTGLYVRITGETYSAGVATKFKAGRLKVYHANEPVCFGRLSGNVAQTTVGSAGAASALPANPTGYQSIMVGGTEYVVPYYAKS
jgi:hypothetical protein